MSTKSRKNVLDKFGLGRMSSEEYQANLTGLNTFFGAVLGLVLAGTEKLDNLQPKQFCKPRLTPE